jgi:WD40 repeat protein
VSGNVAAVDQRAEYAAVISGTSAEQLSISDLTTGATSPVPGGPVSTVAYSGELMLVARTDGTLEVRSADGQHLFHSFAGLVNPVAGPVVASTCLVVELGSDGSAAVFDLGSGQELGTITLPASRTMIYTGIGFSSNGNQLVTATPTFGGPQGPGDITDWDFSPTAWSQIACATAGHQLTETEWNEYVGPGGPSMPSQRACG